MGMPWYKVWENFWVNPKIQYIESKSCGDTTICIFHKLLTHLTKHESIDGVLMLGKRPLMIDELHCIINRSVSQIQEALDLMLEMGMMDTENGNIKILGWSKYQNVEGMLKKRIDTQKRVENHRAKQLFLPSNNDDVTRYSSVTKRNENASKNKELRTKNKELRTKKDIKDKCLYLENVYLKKTEYDKLLNDFGLDGTNKIIFILDSYKLASGKKYVSDYGAINNWVIDRYNKDKEQKTGKGKRWDDGKVVYNELTTDELFGD